MGQQVGEGGGWKGAQLYGCSGVGGRKCYSLPVMISASLPKNILSWC